MQNESVPTQTIAQTQSAPAVPPVSPPATPPPAQRKLFISQLSRKRIFYYLIGVSIVGLVLYIAWAGYRLYLIKNPLEVPGTSACSPDGRCLIYTKQSASLWCPITFVSSNCEGKCGDVKNHCSK